MRFEQVAGPLEADAEALAALSEAHSIKGAAAKIVVIDGVVSDQLSSTEGLPHQAFVGSLREAPLDLMADHLVGLSLSITWSPSAQRTSVPGVLSIARFFRSIPTAAPSNHTRKFAAL